MELLNALQWRYASKKMNGKQVPEEKVERILEAIRLAPSSMGLQPYTVLLIKDAELKKQILPIANNQQQVVDASHMEGFNSEALDQLLGLKEKGLRSITLLPLGYRDAENDWLAKFPKVRR